MASYERKTKGLLRIIHEDGGFRNQMFYNRMEKSVGKVKILSEEYLDDNNDCIDHNKFPMLIDRINSLLTENYAYMCKSRSYSKYNINDLICPYIFCYSEIDFMALKLGLHDGRN